MSMDLNSSSINSKALTLVVGLIPPRHLAQPPLLLLLLLSLQAWKQRFCELTDFSDVPPLSASLSWELAESLPVGMGLQNHYFSLSNDFPFSPRLFFFGYLSPLAGFVLPFHPHSQLIITPHFSHVPLHSACVLLSLFQRSFPSSLL